MDNTYKFVGGITGTVISSAGWLADMENIVSMVCAIIGLLVTIVTCVIVPVWRKIAKASEDGKVTPDEVADIANTLKDGISKIDHKEDK